MKRITGIFVICLMFLALGGIASAAQKNEPVLRVYVGSANTVRLSVSGEYEVIDAVRRKVLSKQPASGAVTIGLQGTVLTLQSKPTEAKDIEIRPARPAVVMVNGKGYRGGMLIRRSNNKLMFINLVGLEDYVRGVVPEEMSESWPLEALKAQAVAARTFALYTKDEEKHDGFDLCPTTHCQAYGGVASEADSVNKAVDATKGEVLQYNGKIIYAAFHSDSGGCTAGSEEVWGGNQPYLRAVADNTAGSPHNKWEESYSIGEMESLLRDNGYDVGTIKEITLAPLKIGKGHGADRYPSGRVQYVKFNGSKGTVRLTGNTMRSVFDLSSTLFDLHFASEKKSGSEHKPKKGGKDKLIIAGHGWGHGLGMSQWGAKIMSARHKYREILKHYYTKTDIKKMY